MKLTVTGYSLSSIYCCQNLQKGGVCISVREDQSLNKIYISLHCTEQTLEVCAIGFETKSSTLKILAMYRALSANFNQCIQRLDATLKYLYNKKLSSYLW
jgi:hypothetical protein